MREHLPINTTGGAKMGQKELYGEWFVLGAQPIPKAHFGKKTVVVFEAIALARNAHMIQQPCNQVA